MGSRAADEKLDVWAFGLESVVFSDEDRRRAMDLHFTQDMTIRKVVARLGYSPEEGGRVGAVPSAP